MSTLDLDFVRSQFPAFAHPDTGRWAHLENAGGSYAARQVTDLLTDFFVATKVQPYWDFAPSRRAGEGMDRAKHLLPATLAADPDEVVLGPSTSQNTYVLAHAVRGLMRPGDEVVVTNQDHEANVGAWRRLEETGIVVREWRVDPVTGLLALADLRPLLSDRTRVVAMTHASNVAATVNPVRDVADLVHAVGGLLVVDGVSYAPHAAVDVRTLDCDVYLYSAYKTYGPHVGVMYVRRSLLAALPNQGHFFNADKPTYKLAPAGPDHAEIACAAGVVDYYRAVHRHHDGGPGSDVDMVRSVFDLFTAHEESLMERFLPTLVDRDGVRLVGAASADRSVRMPTFGFTTRRRPSAEVYRELVAAGVSCGHGNFYAYRLVQALGLDPDDGVVRLSFVHYTSPDEVDRALEVLDKVL